VQLELVDFREALEQAELQADLDKLASLERQASQVRGVKAVQLVLPGDPVLADR